MKQEKVDLLAQALEIAADYEGNLTLRQLYYRLVAGGLLPSEQKAYKRLGDLIGAARLDGSFPLSWLRDRTREAKRGDTRMTLGSAEWALSVAEEQTAEFPFRFLRQARWFNQDKYVMVAVEKEALAGVFEEPCEKLGVPWLVCRGYPSISTVYEMVEHYRQATQAKGKPFKSWVIVYFGDHDPDGLQIPFSLAEVAGAVMNRLEEDDTKLCGDDSDEGREAYRRLWMNRAPRPTIERAALTLAQIRKYNPPSFPAKESSPRFNSYQERTGLDEAWELDALEPRALVDLIRLHVLAHFDGSRWRAGREQVLEVRQEFCDLLRERSWVDNALDGIDLAKDLQAIDEPDPTPDDDEPDDDNDEPDDDNDCDDEEG